jgi:predicted  nucleic acid-binding Zn-ribbon protein
MVNDTVRDSLKELSKELFEISERIKRASNFLDGIIAVNSFESLSNVLDMLKDLLKGK